MEERVMIVNEKGQRLAAWLHKGKDDKRIVILAHGYPSDSHGSQAELARTLATAGINALRFDYRGCGDSEGDFSECMISTAAQDLEAVIAWAREQGYDRVELMGSSFGGAVVLLVMQQHPEIERVLLRSPAPDCTDFSELGVSVDEWREKGFVDVEVGGCVFRIPFSYYEDACEHVMFAPSASISARTLIIHGTEDDVVPLEHAQRLAEVMPHALLIVLEGADHRLRIRGDSSEAERIVVEWFADE